MYPPLPPESSILVLFHYLPDLHHCRLAVPITEMNANVLKHSAFPYRLSLCKPGLACTVWPTPVSNHDDPPASPLLPSTPQCWDCKCGYCAWGLCPFFTLCVIVFNILLFTAQYLWVTSVSSYVLPVFLTVTSSFEIVSLCILDGWSGTWCTVQAGLRRNPPASS